MRIIVLLGLYWGPFILGNYHIGLREFIPIVGQSEGKVTKHMEAAIILPLQNRSDVDLSGGHVSLDGGHYFEAQELMDEVQL